MISHGLTAGAELRRSRSRSARFCSAGSAPFGPVILGERSALMAVPAAVPNR